MQDNNQSRRRESFATALRRAIDRFVAGFDRLHAHLFDAPWRDCDDAGQRC